MLHQCSALEASPAQVSGLAPGRRFHMGGSQGKPGEQPMKGTAEGPAERVRTEEKRTKYIKCQMH